MTAMHSERPMLCCDTLESTMRDLQRLIDSTNTQMLSCIAIGRAKLWRMLEIVCHNRGLTAVARRATFPVKSSAPQTITSRSPKGRPFKPAARIFRVEHVEQHERGRPCQQLRVMGCDKKGGKGGGGGM